MGDQAKPGLWRFGAVELDERLAALRVAGAEVALDRSSYDILLTLLRHAGEVVTKDELLEAGWPGRVVSENSLAKAVSRLRQALGGDAASLRAVHGYGYRLAAAVAFAPVAPDTVEAAPHEAARLREGDRLPHRTGWRLGRRLGEGASGVIMLAVSESGETRAVKLATSEAGLRGLKREIALSRYIRSVRGDEAPVLPVLGWNLSQPPFFLELPVHPEGNLRDWATFRGGLASVPLAGRLALAVALCDSVAALHAIGVIHRDLKPENLYPVADPAADGGHRILLGDLGASDAAATPALAELGITMSILDTARAGSSSRYGGSLLYIAPEVIAGEMPTQRSDLFALGVLVYQLAIGDLRRSLAPGWEADIDDALLREDIALAAAANPARRIGNAQALAQRLRDLDARRAAAAAEAEERARAERQQAQLAHLQRRRRLLLAGSAAMAAMLGVSLFQQGRIREARDAAQAAAATARAEAARTQGVVDFLTDGVLRQGDPYAGAAPATMPQAIDRAAAEVETRFRGDPGVRAAVHGTLGAAYEGMNDYAKASAQFDKQLAALRQAGAPAADIARAGAALCTARHWLGDLSAAEAACRRAHADHLAAGLEPDRPEVFMALGESRHGRYRAALRRLLPRLERIARSGDQDLLGFALWFSGLSHSRLGEPVEAERMYARMVQVHRERAGAQGSMQLAWALTDHGAALLALGREAQGRAELDEATRLFVRFGGADHPHRHAPAIRLARHELMRGRWAAARDLAQPAYAALLPATSWQNWTIYAALAAMTAHARLGEDAQARAIMAAFDDMAERGLDRDFPYLREDHWSGYAHAWLALGQPARARAEVGRLRTLLAEDGVSELLPAKLACFDAELALTGGDREAARAQAGRCHALYARAVPADSPLLDWPRRLLASAGGAAGATPRAAAP